MSPRQTISVRPVVLPAPARGTDLQVRLTAPTDGTGLPVIVFAHGFSQSMDGYAPLVDHWSAEGFVVVQPTFLDSATLALPADDARTPDIWQIRIQDLGQVLDELKTVLSAVPGLLDRVDPERVAVAGHSWGGQSVGMLAGARVLDADGQPGPSQADPRVKAAVLLADTGLGGDDLTPFAQQHFSFMSPDFSELNVPTLVVAGDADQSPLSTRGPDWFTDVYRLAPGAQHLLTLFGAEHSLGGIQAYRSIDTTDEDPQRVDLVCRTSAAFLKQVLGLDNGAAWRELTQDAATDQVGRIETR